MSSETGEYTDVFSYIKTNEKAFKQDRIPLTNSKDWNMSEHIERCKNVANAWFHSGKNDGTRPYNDIVTPIIDVAFRSEGFDVKDIVPYINDVNEHYKSFLVKKYHPRWARKEQLDYFIDEAVETSIIYDLLLVEDINEIKPRVVDLTTIAFCDQADVMAGPICLKHSYTPSEARQVGKKWNKEALDLAIQEALTSKKVSTANDQKANSNTKKVEVYELRGELPESWLYEDGDPFNYIPQMHVVAYYTNTEGDKQGVTLYSGEDKPMDEVFFALKIDQVRSKGRACGRSIVERLFEPQVWNNYSGIKIKEMLDSAVNVIITDSDELGNKKLSELKQNAVVKQEKGANTFRLDGTLQNLASFQNHQLAQESKARELGSASEASLGKNPTSGTPFALQQLIVQEGQGIHEYRQGKIASFFADVLYPKLFLKYLVKDMNQGKKFLEELSLDELQEIADIVARNYAEEQMKEMVLNEDPKMDGSIPPDEIRQELIDFKVKSFKEQGAQRFLEILKGEVADIPLEVMVNIKGKQRRMAEEADKISNLITRILANPQAISQVPGVGKAINQLLEESGMSAIDFSQITRGVAPTQPTEQELAVA